MKTVKEKKSIKNPTVHFDPTFEERHKNIKVPTIKLDKLNEEIKNGNFPLHLFNEPR